jgi:hypothetical protein
MRQGNMPTFFSLRGVSFFCLFLGERNKRIDSQFKVELISWQPPKYQFNFTKFKLQNKFNFIL